MEYEDFSLRIEPKRGDVYPVSVLRSPAGETHSSFSLPFNADQIGDLLLHLGQTVRGSAEPAMRHVSPPGTRIDPQQVGEQLFRALFSGPVRDLFLESRAMLRDSERGLRIKLHIDPEDPSLAQLASLPWELLYREETRDWLNLSRFTPLVRYLEIPRPYKPLAIEPPLRILVVMPDPVDYPRLNLEKERSLIEASWAAQEGVKVEIMEQATILALQDRLSRHPYHVLHYMGHGDFDEHTGQGALVMEDEEGRGDKVDGTTLGLLLRNEPTLRLVFLNACETAQATREQGCDPFAGVATALVMAEIAAVVAMQFPVSDPAAITFAQRFYSLLALGESVDTAVTEGRLAMRMAEPSTMEWATPVLFMRAPHGDIFEVSGAAVEVPPPEVQEPPPQVEAPAASRPAGKSLQNSLMALGAAIVLICVLVIGAPRLLQMVRTKPTPTPTRAVTPSATPCPPVSGPFAQAWDTVRSDIGCSLGYSTSMWMAEEDFEHGKMLWREPIDELRKQFLVLFDDGQWQLVRHPTGWVEGNPEYSCPDENTPSQCPPTPKRGFGVIWCDVEGIRARLGNVTECERGYTGSMQEFARGFMLRSDDDTIYVFFGQESGSWTTSPTPAVCPAYTLETLQADLATYESEFEGTSTCYERFSSQPGFETTTFSFYRPGCTPANCGSWSAWVTRAFAPETDNAAGTHDAYNGPPPSDRIRHNLTPEELAACKAVLLEFAASFDCQQE
jgi:hypothetical protein